MATSHDGAGAQALHGVFDLHAHAHPDRTARSIDALELAKLYAKHGLRGMVLENHFDPTAGLAYLARKAAPGLEVFGGIVLNGLVGGLNCAAIRHMTEVEGGCGRVVWMPTLDSENEARRGKKPRPFVAISEDGRLLPKALAVIDLVAELGLVLATGHSSPDEALMVIRAARERGVRSILATHPMVPPIFMSVEQMAEAADLGAYVEFIYYYLGLPDPPVTVEQYADAIKTIGPDRCILSSCGGQAWVSLRHPEALETLFTGLMDNGLTRAEIDRMAKQNPTRLIGLD